MKIFPKIFPKIFLFLIILTSNLEAQDTLKCRVQNINSSSLHLEMLELQISDHNVVGVWSWDVSTISIPPGVIYFEASGQLHSEYPCFTFSFYDDQNNHSAYSDTVCIDNSYFLLPPQYPSVVKKE